MKYCIFILTLLFLYSCNDQIVSIKNMTSKDSLILSIQGSWKGFKGEPIWDIRPDSIFYYSENKSYYYFIHDNDIVVLYKNGPYRLKNITVTNDTFFFKIGDLNAKAFKSENRNSIKINDNYSKNHSEDEVSHDNTKNKILGKWGYETNEGVFSWDFTKDSINYIQSHKRYLYVQHDNSVIVLREENPTIMKDVALKSDTLFFITQDNVLIKAHKIK